ncbi:FtsQ-type POTRA domain-containing protein [Simiduia sp. 21SJ11W-1]|uniref:cell division protein FtsQ/DivIB n=1 Tax=Simiduia sp. 21SJ11W-1 TaxID=2909669 RepID=UPI00209CA1DE|nr:FtsQ-type POTRA domain-containing protein [Simiduia sp. 21SJ11W-1]UTA48872.1 FtsQ-type POTRA domain-containing protein [Simiduia sp. 21SJ11W-1]
MNTPASNKKAEQAKARPGLIRRCLMLVVFAALCVWLAPVVGEQAINLWDRPVQEVSIEGPFKMVPRERIAQLLSQNIYTGFWKLDIQSLQRAIEQDPWIKAVSIRRRWPDRLMVEVQEQTPIARWGDRGYVNNTAELILVDNLGSALANLPRLDAEDRALDKLMQNYQTIAELLGARNLRLAHIELDARGSWRITLRDGVKVIFGRHRLQERMRLFAKIYDTKLSEHWADVASVDVRYNNGAAVGWRPKLAKIQEEVNTTGSKA